MERRRLTLDVDWLDEGGGALEQRPDLPTGPDCHLLTHRSIIRMDERGSGLNI